MNRNYFRNYFKTYYSARKARYVEMLGGRYANCGSTKDLEFDHIDPKEKLFSITKFLSYPEDVLLFELTKCQLLCKVCHKLKTNPKRQHGTTTVLCWM